jgi:hypothetical protein
MAMILCGSCRERVAVSQGQCLRCYRRTRRAVSASAADLDRYGQPDGYGRYGMIEETGRGLVCHECGATRHGLAGHVYRSHGMAAEEYRTAHGLPRGRGLVSSSVQEKQSRAARDRIGSPSWVAFDPPRDPVAASHSRDRLTSPAPAVHKAKADRAADLGAASRKTRVRVCPGCGAQWCPLPGGYQRRTCGDEACIRLQNRRAIRRRAAARPVLTPAQAAELSQLRGTRLVQYVQQLQAAGVTSTAIAAVLAISPATMTRLTRGQVPASLR